MTTAGITAAYAAEATATTDNAPTLAQPTISTEKAQAFVPFSIEIGMDWPSLRQELGAALQDSKDTLTVVTRRRMRAIAAEEAMGVGSDGRRKPRASPSAGGVAMRAVLLIAAAVGIALYLSRVDLPGLPRVTCSLPKDACPDIFWFGEIHWLNGDEMPTISSVEFRELPPFWGHPVAQQVGFEPQWAASVEAYFDPTQAAACHTDSGKVVCHYIEYGGDLEDLPWYVPTPRDNPNFWQGFLYGQMTWCREPENMPDLVATAKKYDIGQGADLVSGEPTVFQREYETWLRLGGDPIGKVDRVCERAYESR